MGRSTFSRFGLALGLILAFGAGSVYAHSRWTGNFHPVIEGELYRSAQPSAAQLAEWIDRYGIRTVINLRGENAGRSWYDGEVAASASHAVEHVDFKLKASQVLGEDQATRLIAVMRDAKKPLLIHCEAGADRSGLAAALYLAAVAHRGEIEAEAQLSIRYGHIAVWPSGGRRMTESFEALEPMLGFPGS